MATAKTLETSNKLGKQVDTVEAMDLLIGQKKKELQDMSNQYGATHARLVTEQNRITNERAEFNNEMAKEKREFEELKNKKLSDLQQREDNLGKGEQKKHAHLFWEFYEGGGKKAVLKGNWKGIRLNTFKNPDGPIELYGRLVVRHAGKNLDWTQGRVLLMRPEALIVVGNSDDNTAILLHLSW